MNVRALALSSPRLYGTALALATALLFVALPGDGRGQIEQPIAGVGVFAGLPAGSGAGQVVQLSDPRPSIQGSAINCSKSEGRKAIPIGVCAAQIALDDPSGDVIGLTASPAAGSQFVGWVVYPETTPSHRCGVEPVCYVLMGDEVAAIAVFDVTVRPPASPPFVPLTVSRQGPDAESGSVTSNPTGITCIPGGAASCSTALPLGTTVTLTAAPGSAGTFAGWGGACAGAGTSSACTLTLGGPAAVSATFNVATQQLTTTVQGPTNAGGVSSDVQPGISCPTICTAAFAQTSQVTLTATTTPGFGFTGWSGAGCSGTGTCVVLIGAQAQSVTAAFSALPVDANLVNARVVLTGRAYRTRQVHAQLTAKEVVNARIRVLRGRTVLAQRSLGRFGPGIGVAPLTLRRAVPAGRAQVQVTFTNVAGTTKVQTRSITIPK